MSKRKAREGSPNVSYKTTRLPESPLLDIPPEIWRIVSDNLEPLYRTFARFACKKFRALFPRNRNILPKRSICCEAATYRLVLLQWLLVRKFECDIRECARSAAEKGRIKILSWLAADNRRNLDIETCHAAVRGGALDALKWLLGGNHDVLRIEGQAEVSYPFHQNVGEWAGLAARCGHINVLEWIQLDTDFPLDHGQWLYSKAIEGNQVGVFAWLVHNDIPMPEPVVYVKEAASEGRLEILKWMLDDGITIPMACYYYALKRGHRDVMLWFEKLFSPHVFGPEPADISN